MKVNRSTGAQEHRKPAAAVDSVLRNMYGIEVKLTEPGHKYFDQFGAQYKSVSSILNRFKMFDAQAKSLDMAKGDLVKQKALLNQWAAKRDKSSDFGTRFHDAMEHIFYTGEVEQENDDIKELVVRTEKLFTGYKGGFSEKALVNVGWGYAGTLDRIYRVPFNMVDIYDFKTNMAKGIQLTNTYGTYKGEPLEHLMDCNYVDYSLQLSLYGYALEMEYGVRIRRLCIVDVSGGTYPVCLPVMYMKRDVELVLNMAE